MATTGFDILSGFNQRAGEERQVIRAKQARDEEREFSLLEALSRSPDPEIQQAAIAGMLNFADPRAKRKGLAGFLGETDKHPALGEIGKLLKTPIFQPAEVQAGVPGGQMRTPPPAVGAAAQSGTSPVTGGEMTPATPNSAVAAPSHATVSPVQGPPTLGVTAGIQPPPGYRPPAPPRMVARQAFETSEQKAVGLARGKAQGDVEGEVAGLIASGMTEQEARELVKQKYARNMRGGIGGMQRVAIELPDGTQHMAAFNPVNGSYTDPDTGQAFADARPLQRTGSRSLGADREAISKELFGLSASQLQPAQMAQVNQAVIDRGGEKAAAVTTARGNAAAGIPLDTNARIAEINKQNATWMKASQSARDIKGSHAKMLTAMSTVDRAIASGQPLSTVVPPAAEAIIVTFERALDPNSVVREAEANRPGMFSSLLTRLQGAKDRLLGPGGANIPINELRGYVKLAQELAATSSVLLIEERERIGALADSAGIDKSLIFGNDPIGVGPGGGTSSVAPPPTQATPTVPGGGPSAKGPGPEWTMINGVLHYQGKPYQ